MHIPLRFAQVAEAHLFPEGYQSLLPDDPRPPLPDADPLHPPHLRYILVRQLPLLASVSGSVIVVQVHKHRFEAIFHHMHPGLHGASYTAATVAF
jgi:hypothetical protein